ncbi:MAG: prepilin-type N-terminal cleavage/methylation domain-containing protein [Planctomycetota bacterium]
MAEHHRRSAGFTLVEMLVAIGMLVVGLTSLIALMTAGVSARGSAELRDRAARAADWVLHDLETRRVWQTVEATTADPPVADGEGRAPGGGAAPEAALDELAPAVYEALDGFPRLRARVEFQTDPDHTGLVLATIKVHWREGGEAVAEVFQRLVRRSPPFPVRVGRSRSSS